MKSVLGDGLIENDESGSGGYILYDISSSSIISSLSVKELELFLLELYFSIPFPREIRAMDAIWTIKIVNLLHR
jgi:hypothetical protein